MLGQPQPPRQLIKAAVQTFQIRSDAVGFALPFMKLQVLAGLFLQRYSEISLEVFKLEVKA
jgi:hypothetical protein